MQPWWLANYPKLSRPRDGQPSSGSALSGFRDQTVHDWEEFWVVHSELDEPPGQRSLPDTVPFEVDKATGATRLIMGK